MISSGLRSPGHVSIDTEVSMSPHGSSLTRDECEELPSLRRGLNLNLSYVILWNLMASGVWCLAWALNSVGPGAVVDAQPCPVPLAPAPRSLTIQMGMSLSLWGQKGILTKEISSPEIKLLFYGPVRWFSE